MGSSFTYSLQEKENIHTHTHKNNVQLCLEQQMWILLPLKFIKVGLALEEKTKTPKLTK